MSGKKFQNVAKEGLQFSDEGEKEKEALEEYEETYKPLTTWLKEKALPDSVSICFLKMSVAYTVWAPTNKLLEICHVLTLFPITL